MRVWELSNPGRTETAKLLKVVSGFCAIIPFAALGDSSSSLIQPLDPLEEVFPPVYGCTCLNAPALPLTLWGTSRGAREGELELSSCSLLGKAA